MNTRIVFDLAKEEAILEMRRTKITQRIKEIRSLVGDMKVGKRISSRAVPSQEEGAGTLSDRIHLHLKQAGRPEQVVEVAKAIGGKRASVNAALWKMSKDGLLSRNGRGYYSQKAS